VNYKFKYLIILTSISSSLIGCSKIRLSPKDYISHCNNIKNGLIVYAETDSFKYTLQYRTAVYQALIESGIHYKKEQLERQIEEYSGLEYYLLTIQSKSMHSKAEPNLKYLSFDLQNAISLWATDTLKPVMFQFENSSGVSPLKRFSLAFEIPKDSMADRQLIIDHYLDDRSVRLLIPGLAIQNLPNIRL
jgi:hypothetical protein